MILKIKNTPLIDQHDKNFMYGGKFGGNFIPETLKKPIDDLTKLFAKLRKNKKFLQERDHYFKTYVGAPTPFIRLDNLTIISEAHNYAKVVSEANGGLTRFIMLQFTVLSLKGRKKIYRRRYWCYAGKMLSMAAKKFGLNVKYLWALKTLKDKDPM